MSKLLLQNSASPLSLPLGNIPPRVLECFGVAGLLSDKCEIFYTSLFTTQHLGQVSDLIISKIKDKGVDELRLRAALLFGMFDVYHAQQSVLHGERLPEPLVVECGFDEEKVAIGFAFQVPDALSLELTGLSKKILSAETIDDLETDFELLIKYLTFHSHRLIIRFQASTNRLEIVSMLLNDIENNLPDKIQYLELKEELNQIQIVFLPDTKLVTPKASKYIELGDTDYSKAIEDDSPFTRTSKSPTGEVISRAVDIPEAELERLLTSGPSSTDVQLVKGGDKDGLFETIVKGAATAMQDQVVKIAGGVSGGNESDILLKIAGAQAGETHSEIGKFLNMPFSSEKETLYINKIKDLEEKIREFEENVEEEDDSTDEHDDFNNEELSEIDDSSDDLGVEQDTDQDDLVAEKKKKRKGKKNIRKKGGVFASIWPFSKKAKEEEDEEEDEGEDDHDADVEEGAEEFEEGNSEDLAQDKGNAEDSADEDLDSSAESLDQLASAEKLTSEKLMSKDKGEIKKQEKKPLKGEDEENDTLKLATISEEAEKELLLLNEEASRVNPKLKELTEQEEKTAQESKKLMDSLEESSGKMSVAIDNATKTADELKDELGDNAKAKRLVDGMMGELLAERAKLNETAKKLNLTLRQKEMELKNKETAFQEELRKKTEQLKQRNSAVARSKEQLAQVQSQMEKLKTTSMRSSSEDAQNKQKLQQTSKLLENARDENLKLLNKIEELRAQVKQATFDKAKAKSSTGDEHQAAAKLERANRQIDEFKKINQQLMERLNDARKEQGEEANRLKAEIERLKQELKGSSEAA